MNKVKYKFDCSKAINSNCEDNEKHNVSTMKEFMATPITRFDDGSTKPGLVLLCDDQVAEGIALGWKKIVPTCQKRLIPLRKVCNRRCCRDKNASA